MTHTTSASLEGEQALLYQEIAEVMQKDFHFYVEVGKGWEGGDARRGVRELAMCGSRKYPYPSHRRFLLCTPTP